MGNPPPQELITPLTDAERSDLLRETLTRAPQDEPVRVFAYGSLMWSPCFDVAEQARATLHDFHRGFSIWSVYARGTPDAPGLGFALEEKPGAACDGIVFTLPETTVESDLVPLWEREMWTGTYRPEWVPVSVDGIELTALTFVVATDHIQYAGDVPVAEKAAYIVRASGKYGTCYDYLADTVRAMREHGVDDPDMEELLAAVDALMG